MSDDLDLGPMSGDPAETAGLTDAPPKRLETETESYSPSPFLPEPDPEPIDLAPTPKPEPEPAPTREAPPQWDPTAAHMEYSDLGTQAANQWYLQQAQGIQAQLADLPTDPNSVSESEWAAATAKRIVLEDKLTGQLAYGREAKVERNNVLATQIVELQAKAFAEAPDVAGAVMEYLKEKGMGVEALSNPVTYNFLVDKLRGEKVTAEMNKAKMREGARRASLAGAGGQEAPPAPTFKATSQDLARLRSMGIKGDALRRTVKNYQGGN